VEFSKPHLKLSNERRLPSADIFPVARVDASGTTELTTTYLATDDGWLLGIGKTVAWPKCVQQVQGSDGILNYISGQKNAVGCARLAPGLPAQSSI
jgi:phosphate transport system substrate-binding protein